MMKINAYLKPQCGWSMGVRAIMNKYSLEYTDLDIINNPPRVAALRGGVATDHLSPRGMLGNFQTCKLSPSDRTIVASTDYLKQHGLNRWQFGK